MTITHTPRKANLSHFIDEVDRATLPSPVYGGPQRDAINSVVDQIISDLCGKIAELRNSLNVIEQQVLQSAAKSKHRLNEHVTLCIKLNDEILHAQDVVNDLKAAATDA